MIEISNLAIRLGQFRLRNINLTIRDGEYLVLLGPTGAGKTVLVECVLGINHPDNGRILVDGRDITALYPEERNLGYVPQDFALFPNMVVEENLAYGLRARNAPPETIQERVESMIRMLRLEHLRGRSPAHLSAGEKQRVALGRALVTEPRILLLDEPLSALDESLRLELARELREIHRAVGGTCLHVCHSFEEAADLADRVAVMHRGQIVQLGTIDELLDHPASEFVARFTCTRNILHGAAEAANGGCVVRLTEAVSLCSDVPARGRVVVAIRPERIQLYTASTASGGVNVVHGKVHSIRSKVAHVELEIDVGIPLVVHIPRHPEAESLAPGAGVCLRILPAAVRVFEQDSNAE